MPFLSYEFKRQKSSAFKLWKVCFRGDTNKMEELREQMCFDHGADIDAELSQLMDIDGVIAPETFERSGDEVFTYTQCWPRIVREVLSYVSVSKGPPSET